MAQGLRQALDWLVDGAALIRIDGTLLYLNDALQTIARERDGIRLTGDRRLSFSSQDVAARFARALTEVCARQDDSASMNAQADLVVPRAAGAPPYVVSVRPLTRLPKDALATSGKSAVAIVFVHDPLQHDPSTIELLREIFGFTEAEAGLARALQAGVPPAQYARQHGLSLNTIYTHLRHIKDKTGCTRQAQLVRKLGDLRLALKPVVRS